MCRLNNKFMPWLLLAALLATVPLAEARNDRRADDSVAGVFDYYLLALSWSPTFCLTHADNEQCTGKGYGFVLHGLWPQYERGGWPQFCKDAAPLTAAERAQGSSLYVSGQLLSHEWKKHGTCTGLGGAGYFAQADKALAVVKIPPALEPSTTSQSLAPQAIVDLFQRANPGLPSNAVAVRCNGPQLSEVWVCMSKDLTFKACDAGVRNQCRSGEIRIPAVR